MQGRGGTGEHLRTPWDPFEEGEGASRRRVGRRRRSGGIRSKVARSKVVGGF